MFTLDLIILSIKDNANTEKIQNTKVLNPFNKSSNKEKLIKFSK